MIKVDLYTTAYVNCEVALWQLQTVLELNGDKALAREAESLRQAFRQRREALQQLEAQRDKLNESL